MRMLNTAVDTSSSTSVKACFLRRRGSILRQRGINGFAVAIRGRVHVPERLRFCRCVHCVFVLTVSGFSFRSGYQSRTTVCTHSALNLGGECVHKRVLSAALRAGSGFQVLACVPLGDIRPVSHFQNLRLRPLALSRIYEHARSLVSFVGRRDL